MPAIMRGRGTGYGAAPLPGPIEAGAAAPLLTGAAHPGEQCSVLGQLGSPVAGDSGENVLQAGLGVGGDGLQLRPVGDADHDLRVE